MNSEDFISQLISETGLTQEQGVAANGIFESTFLAGNKNKDFIIAQIVEKLGVDESQANMIYNVAIGLLTTGVLSKIKGIFKK
ncbi:hypothetical protein TL18_02800 [Methanobrevibacter sp. YE315]|uniref:hypothetical protein n=1 Tax=Methanobrevibacter sp. YE315 TaxID=1609968 RepID=UPI000764E427|nr:hypothetical protein [Methanobrevibacter sp. YE315]AMD17045.1 hypothetical protein TL18_02800 [Methanobrevibacter sp. YE315]